MNTFKKITELRQIIARKRSAVCLSLDVNNWQLGKQLVLGAGDNICMLKIHPELFKDWSVEVHDEIINLARQYNFQIMCDLKMADVPKIVERQIKSPLFGLSELADWITVMPNNYLDTSAHLAALENPLPPQLLLVAQMNTQNAFEQLPEFRQMVYQMIARNPQIIAIVTQTNYHTRMFGMTPGVILNNTPNPDPARYRDIQTAITRDKNNIVILGAALLEGLANLDADDIMTKDMIHEFVGRVKLAAQQSWDALCILQP